MKHKEKIKMIQPIIRIGTRKSPLAMAQTIETAEMLKQAWPELREEGAIEIVKMQTSGDRIQDRHLLEVGGKGLFTREIDEAMLEGKIDIGVNSMKDVPTQLAQGQILGCVLEREDVHDVFISPHAKIPEKLPHGAKVGTASLRRQALLKNIRPDLEITLLRGNVQTRLKKIEAGEADGTFLALAGLKRLGLASQISFGKMKIEDFLPAPAQGAVGITCRANDEKILKYLAPLHHKETEYQILAERGFLKGLDGSCRTPIAAYGQIKGDEILLEGWIAKPNGQMVIKKQGSAPLEEAEDLGLQLAQSVREAIGDLEAFLKAE